MKKSSRIGILAVGAILLIALSIGIYLGLDSRYTVTIKNDTASPIERVQISGGGCDATIDKIDAGDSAKRHFWIQSDGRLELRVGADDEIHIIDGYVTGSLGGNTSVTIHQDGTVIHVNHHTE